MSRSYVGLRHLLNRLQSSPHAKSVCGGDGFRCAWPPPCLCLLVSSFLIAIYLFKQLTICSKIHRGSKCAANEAHIHRGSQKPPRKQPVFQSCYICSQSYAQRTQKSRRKQTVRQICNICSQPHAPGGATCTGGANHC